jgi:iron complex outermembrane recepter protein
MKIFIRQFKLTAVALCCLSACASAAAAEPSTKALEEVTITASPLDAGILVPAQRLSGAALFQRQGSTLGETLDNLPGVSNSSFGPNVGRPVIRGLDGDRIQILQNGGANLDVSGLSFDHALPIDPLITERIDVLRGPATLLYGGSAIGGVVNVMDNRIARERVFDQQGGVAGKVELRVGGAAQERSSAAMVEAGNDRYALHVDAFERNSRDMRVPRNMNCSGTNLLCNSAARAQGGGAGATLYIDQGFLGLSSSEHRSRYGTVAEENVQIGMVRRHHVMAGEYRPSWAAVSRIKFQWGRTQYSHTEYEGANAGVRFDTHGNDMRLEAHQSPRTVADNLLLDGVVGLQRDTRQLTVDEGGSVYFLPPSRSQSQALFTYQSLKTSWGQLSAGARSESVVVKTQPTASVASEKRFQPFSASIGVMRHARSSETKNGWQLSANVSQSERAPKDYELFADGPHIASGTYELGDPNSALEKATQWDVGGEWQRGAHRFSLTGFVSDFANFLSLQSAGGQTNGLPNYRYQGVKARFVGFESQAKLRLIGGADALLSSDARFGATDLALRYDQVRADDLTHQTPMPRIAPTRLGADVLWARHAWGARLGAVHASAQNRVPDGNLITPSYTLWQAAVNYHHHEGRTHWMWFAKLDNLTNQVAYSASSILRQTMPAEGKEPPPLAGRSLKVGVQASF